MKTQLAIALSILALVIMMNPVYAHPSDSIAVALDSTGFLSVEVHHPLKNYPSPGHYISQVTVSLNGKTIITQNFRRQSSKEWQYVYYRLIDAQPGDKIGVTATCSILGKQSVSYTVPGSD